MSTEPEKISAVRQWPVPTNVHELHSFLGFASYYRCFVKGFAKVAAPLHALLGGNTAKEKQCKTNREFVWTREGQGAFEHLIATLTTAPVLGYARYDQPFILETDASFKGLGAVLSQDQDGKHRVIAYASRGLRGAEKNRTTAQ